MNVGKLAACTENRTCYFYIVQATEIELSITMYNTRYILAKDGETWTNGAGNYFLMAQHLIDAVITSAFEK